MRILPCVFGAGLAVAAGLAQAATVASFEGANLPGDATVLETGTGVTEARLSRGPDISQGAGSPYRSVGWTTTNTLAAAETAGDFYLIEFSSTRAYDLTGLTMDLIRSNGGPVSWALVLTDLNDVDVVDTVLGSGATPLVSGATAPLTVDLSAYDDVFSAVFRLYGYGATDGLAGRMSIRDELISEADTVGLAITGELSPVPLPAAAPLLLVGLGGLAALGRRRTA